jgi:hypothetical protein
MHVAVVGPCCVSFSPRSLALELGIDMCIKRVPTKENISDDPSRERYGLLQRLGVSLALGSD